ncbi:LOW QUALITY PROTEIN: MICOS complex subunit MIC27 [Ursus americanus]|uniref:LOW QUALITY PROTEIN: MICOS complex subunit MIC27 n=1 Tax=Ursus americanus TaxID=9643 RepID=UPI001E6799D8|nr:LOW QUALITY PROTEIN: MICOS complex subunit MIC27 [Ursus americanus]
MKTETEKVIDMAAVRMGKLTTIPAGLICASVTVHAAKEDEYKKQLVKPEQLPIYILAPPLRSKYVEEQPGHLQMGFASIRTTTGRYIGWCKGVYVFVKNGIMDTVQFGKDAYIYLKNPPRDFLPKLGVITVSGLAGLVSARKGSRFKKIAYPLGLATLGATVCYPVQSVIIAKVTGKKAYTTSQQIYEAVKSLWTKMNKKESFPKPKEKSKLGNSAEIEIPAKTTDSLKHSVPLPRELSSETKTKSESTSGATQFMPDPKLMDHGQSHPEDIDMYSTRS